MVVLLRGRFFAVVLGWSTALEESIDDGAGVKQVWGETQRRVRFYLGERNRRAGTEIRPLGRDEGATSIRQDQDEMKLALVTPSPKDSQGFPLKRMMGANDRDVLRQAFVVGSVSWGPLTRS